MKRYIALALTAVALLTMGRTAVAEQNLPGSVLVYPCVTGSTTWVTITNTYDKVGWPYDPDGIIPNGNVFCFFGDNAPPEPNNPLIGATRVHLLFFVANDCTVRDAVIDLSPGDHVTFRPEDVGLTQGTEEGWLVAYAGAVQTSGDPEPWSFDFLIGSAWVLDTADDFSFAYNAYAFLSKDNGVLPPAKEEISPTGSDSFFSRCERERYTNDVYLDFDGTTEYEEWPDVLYLTRFFEDNPVYNNPENLDPHSSLLVLVAPLNTHPDERETEITVGNLFWNNDENEHGSPFSRTFDMNCHFKSTLRDISMQYANLGGTSEDDEENTGWGLFDGYSVNGDFYRDPALLGIFVQLDTPGMADETEDLNGFSHAQNFFTRGFNKDTARIFIDATA